jgi:hypothetical protein
MTARTCKSRGQSKSKSKSKDFWLAEDLLLHPSQSAEWMGQASAFVGHENGNSKNQ